MSTARPAYPMVRCGRGHKDEPGYAVCVHVMNEGVTPAKVDLATNTSLGIIKCARSHVQGEIMLCCASCVRRAGWLAGHGTN